MVRMVVRLRIDRGLPLAKALERIVGVMADVETLLRHSLFFYYPHQGITGGKKTKEK